MAALNLNLKKILVVAGLGVVLFVGSFVASDRINASNIFCGPENIWYDVFGIEQCGRRALDGFLLRLLARRVSNGQR